MGSSCRYRNRRALIFSAEARTRGPEHKSAGVRPGPAGNETFARERARTHEHRSKRGAVLKLGIYRIRFRFRLDIRPFHQDPVLELDQN